MKNYKDHIFDVESGEIIPDPDKTEEERQNMNSLEYRLKYPHMPINGLGVTRKFLNENCLKLGDKCPRFRSVSYSEGRIQAVMCFWGPYKKCEKARGGR